MSINFKDHGVSQELLYCSNNASLEIRVLKYLGKFYPQYVFSYGDVNSRNEMFSNVSYEHIKTFGSKGMAKGEAIMMAKAAVRLEAELSPHNEYIAELNQFFNEVFERPKIVEPILKNQLKIFD